MFFCCLVCVVSLSFPVGCFGLLFVVLLAVAYLIYCGFGLLCCVFFCLLVS